MMPSDSNTPTTANDAELSSDGYYMPMGKRSTCTIPSSMVSKN